MGGAYMKPLDLNLDEEPYEIKITEIKMDNNVGQEKLKKEFKLNLEVVKKIDKTTKLTLIGIIISFFGCFFNFWGLKVEGLGNLGSGNFFNGYGIKGVLGIIFILSIIATLVLMYIKLNKYALIADAVSGVVFLFQVIIILIWGKGSFVGSSNISIYFGSGFYICLLGIIFTTYCTYSNYKNSLIKK